jgi:hypothetical protein
MGYLERGGSQISVGCLPATIFGFVVATPAMFAIFMGECVDERGWVGPCPHKGLHLLVTLAVIGSLCFVVTWTTNLMVRGLARHGYRAGWGVAGGLVFAAALVALLYTLLFIRV